LTGPEFREARHDCGLSVRGAASRLGVSASTIQRWEGGAAVIPSDAADRIRLAAARGDFFAAITTGMTTAEIRALAERLYDWADRFAGDDPWLPGNSPAMRAAEELHSLGRGFSATVARVGQFI
jgi:transcriptional regulator with XRE-family HTH domain